MIPKIIHYCWFGDNKMTALNQACLDSWKLFYPNYEIILWNETNAPIDHPYIKKALAEKKYAFAADFTRFYALYHYGGIYLDTDMECIKPLDDKILDNNFFSAYEDIQSIYISCGFIGAIKDSPICLNMLKYYDKSEVYENVPVVLTNILKNSNQKFKIYPNYYFYPYNPYDLEQPIKQLMFNQIKHDTYAIHHWQKSWKLNLLDKLRKMYQKYFGY